MPSKPRSSKSVLSKLLLAGAALFVVLVLAPARALACSCMAAGPPCQAFGSASAVFVGTVTGARERKAAAKGDEEINWTPIVFKFTVLQPFLGVEAAEFEVATGRGGGDCGYGFRKGETYVVYAHEASAGSTPVTGICTRTRRVAEAADDLEFLRGLAGRGSGVSIGVKVTRAVESVKAGDSKPVGGLAGAKVVVEGGGERREVSTDARGSAQLSGLSPGAYKVRLVLPEELTTHKPEQEVTIADRGCATVSYSVSDNGRIGGRVSDTEGRAAAGVLVTLADAEEPESEHNYARYERTDEEGRYAFSGVPPGRYLLAVNLVRYPQAGDVTHAYPRTFYPGVAQAAQAEVIRLGAGESVRDRDLTVPARRAEHVLEGQVVWEDGRPVAKAGISFRDSAYGDPGSNIGLQADEQGRFQIRGYQGQTLLIHASSGRQFTGDPRRDGPMERAEPLRVTLGEQAGPVRIVITKLR